jgi:hypothetical protein
LSDGESAEVLDDLRRDPATEGEDVSESKEVRSTPPADPVAVERLVSEAQRRRVDRGLSFAQALDAVRVELPEVFAAGTRHYRVRE